MECLHVAPRLSGSFFPLNAPQPFAHQNLRRLNSFFDNVDAGEYLVKGDVECFSCKLAGFDKKLSRSLESEVQLELASSPEVVISASPVGPLSEASSRKTLIYLILTLNHIYPDYDFTVLRAHHFRREAGGVPQAEEEIDESLVEVARVWEASPENGDRHFRDTLWKSVDEAVDLKDCDVYSYQSDLESDPFGEEGSIWSFNYFFYNRKLKRILYLSCRGISKTAAKDVSWFLVQIFALPSLFFGTL